jgi:hypothetical protein
LNPNKETLASISISEVLLGQMEPTKEKSLVKSSSFHTTFPAHHICRY